MSFSLEGLLFMVAPLSWAAGAPCGVPLTALPHQPPSVITHQVASHHSWSLFSF